MVAVVGLFFELLERISEFLDNGEFCFVMYLFLVAALIAHLLSWPMPNCILIMIQYQYHRCNITFIIIIISMIIVITTSIQHKSP